MKSINEQNERLKRIQQNLAKIEELIRQLKLLEGSAQPEPAKPALVLVEND